MLAQFHRNNLGMPMTCGTRCIIFLNGFALRYQRVFELDDLMKYPLLLILGTAILLALKDDEFRLTDCYVEACFAPGLIL